MINLYYIRAAVEANTGQRVSFPTLRRLLVEEGLITREQAEEDAADFRGYGEFFETESFDRHMESRFDEEEGLPDEDGVFSLEDQP